MKIVFMGTPDFARESLKAIYEKGHQIVGVITNEDKPKGRGMKMMFSPVKEYAVEHQLEVYQPHKIRNNDEIIELIKKLNPDVICVVAYGKILPKEILDIPPKGCINVHASILPKYRGAAPIQWAVINGDEKTGITTMFMDEGMDTGDIILAKEVNIDKDETTGELWNRLSILGGELLVETLENIENGTVTRIKQSADFSMAPMLNKSMAKINWKEMEASQIKNLVRGLNPIMGTYSYLNGKKIKFWKVDVLTQSELLKEFPELEDFVFKMKDVMPGTVLFSDSKKGLFIKANSGFISVIDIQGENAKRMNIKDFLRGNQINIGEIFE